LKGNGSQRPVHTAARGPENRKEGDPRRTCCHAKKSPQKAKKKSLFPKDPHRFSKHPGRWSIPSKNLPKKRSTRGRCPATQSRLKYRRRRRNRSGNPWQEGEEKRSTPAAKVVPKSQPKEVLPLYDDLPEEHTIGFGTLGNQCAHVFPNPSERRVFINMKGYREGDVIGESGFKLVEITSTGLSSITAREKRCSRSIRK
jgi:hypothetical protein